MKKALIILTIPILAYASTPDNKRRITYGEFSQSVNTSQATLEAELPKTKIVRLLTEIRERNSQLSQMPVVSPDGNLENRLLMELANEVLLLKEQNQKLAAEIEKLKK